MCPGTGLTLASDRSLMALLCCVCMRVCMYACVHAYTHMHVHVCTCVLCPCVHACVCVRACVPSLKSGIVTPQGNFIDDGYVSQHSSNVSIRKG